MSKKILTPEELKAKNEKKAGKRKRFWSVFLQAAALCLGCAMVFLSSFILFSRREAAKNPPAVTPPVNSQNANTNKDANTNKKPSVQQPAPDTDIGSDNSKPSDSQNGSQDNNPDGKKPAEGENKLSTDKQKLDYFLQSFNNVKKNAKSTTLVWKKDSNYKDIADVPLKLSSTLAALLDQFLVEEEPKTVYTGKDITENFPPKGGAECRLKASDIKAFKFEEKGNYYEVTIVVKDSVNTQAGESIGAIASVLTTQQITDPIKKIPVLNTLVDPKCEYENGTVVAKIEKKTGNLVEYYTSVPLVLTFDSLSAHVGLQFEERWEIAY